MRGGGTTKADDPFERTKRCEASVPLVAVWMAIDLGVESFAWDDAKYVKQQREQSNVRLATAGAEERRRKEPRAPPKAKITTLKASNYFSVPGTKDVVPAASSPPAPREPFVTYSRLKTSSTTTYNHSPARHLSKKTETTSAAPRVWGSSRWGGSSYKSGSSKPKERYSDVALRVSESSKGVSEGLETPMLEVIGALQDYGEELLPLATALKRLVESGDLKKAAAKRSATASPRLTVWPHKLIDPDAGTIQSPTLPPPPQTAYASATTQKHNLDMDAYPPPPATAAAAVSAEGGTFELLSQTQDTLASRLAEVAKTVPAMLMNSRIENLVELASRNASAAAASTSHNEATGPSALVSLVSGSMLELIEGLVDVSQVAAQRIELYQNESDSASATIAELTDERDKLLMELQQLREEKLLK